MDPKQLLEDGIRKELVRQVAEALNSIINFPVTKVCVCAVYYSRGEEGFLAEGSSIFNFKGKCLRD